MNAGLGALIIILALVLLTVMAFKGIPIVLASLVSALAFLLVTDASGAYAGIMEVFMARAGSFVSSYFLIFLLGALFGAVVEISGAAESIAQLIVNRLGERFILVGIVIASAILTIGGVSVYVAFFAIYPFAVSLFRKADIPRRLFVAAYMAGAGTFTMTMPFSPSIQNIIPTTYLGTTVSAGTTVGLICAAVYAVMACAYIYMRQAKCRKNGEHFVTLESDVEPDENAKLPNALVAILPMVILLVTLNVFGLPIEICLLLAIISAFILYFPYYPHDFGFIMGKLGDSVKGAAGSILNTGATVGFGGVISTSAAFQAIIPIVTGIGGNPLIGVALSTTALAGMAGSASGGLGIAVPIVAEAYLPLGVNVEALHRVAAMASSGLDSLPHNGGVITFLNYSHTTHKEGYFDVFVVSVVFTIIEIILGIILFTLFGQVYV